MRAEKAGKIIISKLNRELPHQFKYHNSDHILDVHNAARRIAESEEISDAELDLLLTAAWYHDAGFLTTIKGHEEESCRIAMQTLPDAGFNKSEISKICNLIMATRVPQSPNNHLEQILADADLDYLGRDDFFSISEKLFEELTLLGTVQDRLCWDKLQINFLQEHRYFTKTSINTRQAQKEHNLAEIKARLHLHEK